MRMKTYDAVIVGARCAGAATAMLLARRGLSVLVLERARPGTDTLSTHALMRGGVVQLRRWGLLDRLVEAGTPPVRRTSFHYGDETVTVSVKPAAGVDALYAPRRTLLDRVLVDAAVEAGAEVRFGVDVTGVLRHPDGRVGGVVARTGAAP
jgi:flavin-dependent dehydrogenase